MSSIIVCYKKIIIYRTQHDVALINMIWFYDYKIKKSWTWLVSVFLRPWYNKYFKLVLCSIFKQIIYLVKGK